MIVGKFGILFFSMYHRNRFRSQLGDFIELRKIGKIREQKNILKLFCQQKALKKITVHHVLIIMAQ